MYITAWFIRSVNSHPLFKSEKWLVVAAALMTTLTQSKIVVFAACSHIACRAHSVPLPCRAAKGLECVFPIWFTKSSVSDSHLSCHAHAMLWPCRSSQGHGTVRPSKDGLWATCPRSASSGYHAEFHEGCYQKHTNLRCRWPVWNQTMLVMDEEKSVSSTLQKKTIC